MLSSLTDGVTKEQRAAILHDKGPAIVSAAPGSGKTMTITRRIAILLERGINPYNIVGITFTNKAAAEMKNRVVSLVGKVGYMVPLSTFHSYCCRIIRRNYGMFGLNKNFSIADDNDASLIFDHAIARVEGTTIKDIKKSDLNRSYLRAEVSHAKNNLLLPDNVVDNKYNEKTYLYYREYQNLLSANNMIDFDDMLLLVAIRLRSDQRMQKKFADRIYYLLVDEFQDTNYAQFELVYWMSHIRQNLFVVGDLDQSIYGWRGAEAEANESRFFDSFPNAAVYLLQTNFRSVPPIVKASNVLITKNKRNIEKTSKAYRSGGKKPLIAECANQRDEAFFVVRDIMAAMRTGLSWKDHAILYRTRNQHRWFEEACIKNNIPYRIIGGKGFFQKAVVRNIIAYLSLVANPRDDISFTRIYNKPRRGIGKDSFFKLSNLAKEKNVPLLYALRYMDECKELVSPTAFKGLYYLKLMFTKLIKMPKNKVGQVVQEIVRLTDMSASFDKRKADDKDRMLQDLSDIIQAAHDYDQMDGGGVVGFLEYAAMMQTKPKGDSDDENKVLMMTIHAAKGLEFSTVYLVGADSGTMPIIKDATNKSPDELVHLVEEERRIFFVAMTRAKDRLVITYPKQKVVGHSVFVCDTSPFILELGDHVTWKTR